MTGPGGESLPAGGGERRVNAVSVSPPHARKREADNRVFASVQFFLGNHSNKIVCGFNTSAVEIHCGLVLCKF